MDPASLAAAMTPATRLVWLEAPGSVTMEFPDLPALVAAARAAASSSRSTTPGAPASPSIRSPSAARRRAGVDISIQALTKYPSGGADVLMGSVTTRDAALHRAEVRPTCGMGWGVGGNDAELVLRSLPSLALRYEAQDARRPRAGAVVGEAPRGRARAASGLGRIARP